MIILDTNVISEPLKPLPSEAVERWFNRQIEETLFLASPVFAELLSGVEGLPAGKRKQAFKATLEGFVHRLFEDRILPFDEAAAKEYTPMMQRARSAGYVISLGDGQIAAIAAVHGFTVATRDVEPFQAAGVPVLNPWEL